MGRVTAARARSGPRVLLSGYYGCGNLGDEAVLAGALAALRARSRGTARVTVLSADTDDTVRRHGVAAVNRFRWREVREALRDCDVLASGGGSLLQDVTSLRSLVYYLWVLRSAQAAGKSTMVFAQGIGPLRRPVSRLACRWVLARCRYITVRDRESSELLRELRLWSTPIEVTADLAFALGERRAAEPRAADPPVVGFAMRPWPGGPSVDEWATAVASVAARGARVQLIPLQQPRDAELSDAVAAHCASPVDVVSERTDVEGMRKLLAGLHALVGMRLHSLILAALAGVPCIGISYDPKVDALMTRLGLSDRVVDARSLNQQTLLDLVYDSVADREALRGRMGPSVARMFDLAMVNADRALGLAA